MAPSPIHSQSGVAELAELGVEPAGTWELGSSEAIKRAARLAGRPLSPAERSFVATLTRCCVKNAEFADACVGAAR